MNNSLLFNMIQNLKIENTQLRVENQKLKNELNTKVNVIVIDGFGLDEMLNSIKSKPAKSNSEYFIINPKEALLKEMNEIFEDKGYRIHNIDTVDFEDFCCYDPFVNTEPGIDYSQNVKSNPALDLNEEAASLVSLIKREHAALEVLKEFNLLPEEVKEKILLSFDNDEFSLENESYNVKGATVKLAQDFLDGLYSKN